MQKIGKHTASVLLVFALANGPTKSFCQNVFPATGNVGIGTSSPQAALDVQSVLQLSAGRNGDGTLSFPRTPSWGRIGATQGLALWANGQAKLDDAPQMILLANGNVGVGTKVPDNLLTVAGSGRFDRGVLASGVGFRVGSSVSDLVNNATWYGLGASNLNLKQNGNAVQLAGYYGLNFQTGAGQMVMTLAGNVGIGTINPTSKLAVNGVVKAREVNVTVQPADWPDYVFHRDYRLPSPDSLSAVIGRLGHLPGMPSASEVSENGVSLGEMNRQLLEKVEELTLLLIKQDLEIRQLHANESSIELMKTRIEKLEKYAKEK